MFRCATTMYLAVTLSAILPTVAQPADPPAKPPAQQLVDAAREGKLDEVERLLADGVDVNSKGRYNITPLWQAASKNRLDVAEKLLEAGADVNVADQVWHMTPLMMTEDAGLITRLVQHDAKGADALLYRAALYGQQKTVTAILAAEKHNERWLALAKAHAKMGGHDKVVEIIAKAADKPLPELARLDAEAATVLTGKYISDRLNEVEVSLKDGELHLKYETSPLLKLIPLGKHEFVRGSSRYEFEVRVDKVVRLVQDDVFSARHYRPLVEEKAADPTAEGAVDEQGPHVATTNWPSFRGPAARGVARDQNLPERWNVADGEGIRWKTPIPGLAHSCPIVWGNQVFLTTAVSGDGNNDLRIGLYGSGDAVPDKSEHTWQLMSLDHRTGKVQWQRKIHSGVPPVKRHLKSTQANSTPATDGQHVVAMFNTGDLQCFTIDGKLLWKHHLGLLDSGAFNDPEYQWGYGSSPTIYRDRVIVQCDRQQDSFLAAYDLESGEVLWKTPRDEIPSWGTPTVCETPRGPTVLTNASNFARGYDALSGRERWRLGGNAAITVPTPFVAHGLAFVTSGYRPIQPIFAVRLDARGDISLAAGQEQNEHIAWSKSRGGPYLPTPIVYGDYFYTCANNGIFTCYDAKTGSRLYRKRVAGGGGGSFTASPVAADGRIYLTSEDGTVRVVKAGPKFELLGEFPLNEYCLSTPAIAGGSLLIRTHKHLIAIGSK